MTVSAQLPLDLGHRPALAREDFLVAPGNREAVAWLDRWPQWPAPALVVYGPAGCGKTHLAHVWRLRSRAVLLSPAALTGAEPPALLAGGRCCVVEDADRGVPERPLLHLYNTVAERDGHLLLTARHPPARWALALPDLRSRLGAAPAVAVGAPDDDLIGAVLVKLFADRQLVVGHEVIVFLLTRMERSFAAARAVVADIDAAALATRRRVTVPLVREVLRATRDGEND